MTPITRNLWRDLTPDCSVEPGALPSAVRTFATTFQGVPFFGTLVETDLENGGARLDIRAKTSAEGFWEKVAELALTHRTDVNQGGVRHARVFTGIVADGANDAELLRIDVVGGGFTAAVTSADGVVFEASQAVDIGAPVLDVAVVATQIQGIVALARKIGTEASGLWKATGPGVPSGRSWKANLRLYREPMALGLWRLRVLPFGLPFEIRFVGSKSGPPHGFRGAWFG